MKILRVAFFALIASLVTVTHALAGQGALLGVNMSEPNVFFQSLAGQGANYDAGSSTLTITSTPVFLTFTSGGAEEFIIGGSLSLTATIDNTGAFLGGSYSISGSSTDTGSGTNYSGVLIAGTVLDYGIVKVGATNSISDYLVSVDSGSMKALFDAVGSTAGIIVAHENSTYDSSFAVSWSGNAKGDAGPISETPPIDPNAHTIGYWKTHPEAWPVSSLSICGAVLDQSELISVLKTPVRGDKTISMAHQLIAGLLGGVDAACGTTLTTDAEDWLCSHGGIAAGRKQWDGGEALKDALDDYNNTGICP